MLLPLLAALPIAGLPLALGSTPAHAAARVDVSPAPSADAATTVALSGSGFQYQPNAPGGVYVFFGAVADPATNSWSPSQGGKSGETFAYAGTDGSRLLVAFAGGSSSGEANGVIDANGAWSAQLTIPGARFTASFGNPHEGAQGAGQEIDCLQVQCGIITIGAHGLVNANNESFTPVSFAAANGQLQSGSGAVQEFGGASTNDAATKIEVPGAAEAPAAAADETGAETTAAAPQPAAAPGVADTPDATLTWVVLGVLAVAVLALGAAITVVTVKRRGAARALAASTATATPPGPGAPASGPAPEGTVTGGASAAFRAREEVGS
ncbi:hypothetical protein D3228_01270 [Leucobacter luti]|nr:hypothetical protein [Leucobacter luti]